ncbi:MAG: glucose-6-phosphate isomerase [bacterium]|nr:glucose-6-phosphate isomerase [bacterium]
MDKNWENFKKYYFSDSLTGLSLDISRTNVDNEFVEKMRPLFEKAFADMDELEHGAIANPDENRMVGHYWLRNSDLAPTIDIKCEIDATFRKILEFADKIHSGAIRPERAERFTRLLVIGIGGSALGPEFVSKALANADAPMKVNFFDNTDPDGMELILKEIGSELHRTLTVVISKSGGTKETRNGMLEAQNAYDLAGLHFGRHAAAVTGANSELYKYAKIHEWLEIFPMWDWVGGRTSELSAVGLLPAALQGLDIDDLIKGAAAMDQLTRVHDIVKNPAALLALAWYKATDGHGSKDMVILPYCDRLELFSRYLQQLIMESLGKDKDLKGNTVNQGIAVYGNKGSTDQHAYVQQLRDGLNNFFVTFIAVLRSRKGPAMEVEEGITTGDYLFGFWQGTREALTESGRQSLLITIPEVSAYTVGTLIALYERTVGLYASLIGINAYHQPGVEAGKKAAGRILKLQAQIVEKLKNTSDEFTAEELAKSLDMQDKTETIFHICQHLAFDNREGIVMKGTGLNAKYYFDIHKL